jgi:hypothetical protein
LDKFVKHPSYFVIDGSGRNIALHLGHPKRCIIRQKWGFQAEASTLPQRRIDLGEGIKAVIFIIPIPYYSAGFVAKFRCEKCRALSKVSQPKH